MRTDDRRSFLKKLSISGLGMTVIPAVMTKQAAAEAACQPAPEAERKSADSNRIYNSPYTGTYLNRVAFPIGGIGAGMFCLEGTGAVSHLSVRHRPEIFNEPGIFAAIAVKGAAKGVKVLEGPVPEWKKFGPPGTGLGSTGATFGLPRFQQAAFTTRFPFADIILKDEDIPLEVRISGWSPFIPTDEDNSSLPVGALEYHFTNNSTNTVTAVFSFNTRNFMVQGGQGSIQPIQRGFVLTQQGTQEKPHLQGSFAIYTDAADTVVDHCWFRGGWWDALTMAWNTVKAGEIKQHDPVESDAPGASLFVPLTLEPGATKTIRVMMAWYVPDTNLRIGEYVEKKDCLPEKGCCVDSSALGINKNTLYTGTYHKPWYSSRFKDIAEVADYWTTNYTTLYKNTALFRDAFYASTLPPEVMEAVAANLTIIKSPTVMRQYDGRMWNWEGCGDNEGSCHGSCTHVWNYAQAIPHLFPALERSLRHTEFCENQSPEGHQGFRANLPISPLKHDFHAASDGQLGGIMKVYREWRISGDNNWLKKMYPMVKVSMDYCSHTWDPKGKGVVEEPHHNTYDIEFWGPTGICTSFYLGALQAIIKMGHFLKEDVSGYEKLYARGQDFMEQELFNGEYFTQQIRYKDLVAADPVKGGASSQSKESLAILEKEGPKYQYGTGCLSDGVLGAWIAGMCGLEDPLDKKKTTQHLTAVHQYNLKKDLSDHANPQRPGFALGNDGGLLLCSWPKGGKLSLPFVYSDEVWTGIEYQVASHLMLMGKVEEGLDIVRVCRNRYDGRVRNPFNEYECGHWYARAMSSYGLLQGLTGIRYDAVDNTLYIDSRIGDFTCFIGTATGFGTVSLRQGKPALHIAYGDIKVKQVIVAGKISRLA
ncbi:GH116 family glycosyl hydrolase [Chitinophaga sp. MM2321]|uniref:GH116 family glycosyl hydrolase n=1 Tax=Chitinophaga sp. MM2321 TaxID=3137178 RepID=UPI0032D57E6B